MLQDLNDLQNSEEVVWGTPDISFEIEARSDNGNELMHRRYVFNYAKGWDKWIFSEFEEKRTENVDRTTARNWRRTRHITWDDPKAGSVEIPENVKEELNEQLDQDVIIIQNK